MFADAAFKTRTGIGAVVTVLVFLCIVVIQPPFLMTSDPDNLNVVQRIPVKRALFVALIVGIASVVLPVSVTIVQGLLKNNPIP